jgi:Putative oxalocrotonate tautomerase enzyme
VDAFCDCSPTASEHRVARDVVVRISIDRIAGRTLPEDREKMLNFLDGHIHPFVADRGFEWELHIDETSPDACEIQTGDSVV